MCVCVYNSTYKKVHANIDDDNNDQKKKKEGMLNRFYLTIFIIPCPGTLHH